MIYVVLPLLLIVLPGCQWFGRTHTNDFMQEDNLARQEKRQVAQFNALEVRDVGTVIFTQGDTYECIIEADGSIIPYIVSKVDDHVLCIHVKNHGQVSSQTPITYYVTAPHIKHISLNGSAGFQSAMIRDENIIMQLDGASEVSARCVVHSLHVEATDSAKISLHGETDTQKIITSGAVEYDAGLLKSCEVIVDASGSSRITVYAQQILHAVISDTVSLFYHGEPCLTIKQSGMATINTVG